MKIVRTHMKGSALPVVMAVGTVMCVIVLGILCLWEGSFLLLSRTHYLFSQTANIESFYTVYRNHPSFLSPPAVDTVCRLFDSLPSSEMRITKSPWGLYEIVTVSSLCGKVKQARMMGAAQPDKDGLSLWCNDHNTSLALTGYTNLQGSLALPLSGVRYSQSGGEFFRGEQVNPNRIKSSMSNLPMPYANALQEVDTLLSLIDGVRGSALQDSMSLSFYELSPEIFYAGSGVLNRCHASGKVIIAGEELVVDSTCNFRDIIIACRKITVSSGFKGSIQIFARDTVIVEERACMESPSGVYAGKYAEQKAGSVIEGYMVVNDENELNVRKANCVKARTSVLRGLLYVEGSLQLQGIVTGAVFVNTPVLYTPRGYFANTIHDATIIYGRGICYPIWIDAANGRRKDIKWVM